MNDEQFQELMQGIKEMGQHRRGELLPDVRLTEIAEPDVKAIREKTGLSQTRFAQLIGVNPKTLQNWEQKRVRPAGPARALLKIVEANPNALAAIHD